MNNSQFVDSLNKLDEKGGGVWPFAPEVTPDGTKSANAEEAAMEVIQMQPDARIPPPHPVTHTIQVAGMEEPMDAVNLIHRLSQLDGVLEVDASWKSGALTMTYDLRRVHIEDVESALVALGFPPDDAFWSRVKLDWVEFHEHREIHHMEVDEQLEAKEEHMPWDP